MRHMFGERAASSVKCSVISSLLVRRTKAEGRVWSVEEGETAHSQLGTPSPGSGTPRRQELKPKEKFQGQGPSHVFLTHRELTVDN